MLHHVSISAIDPLRVATVLAEVMQGFVAPFPPNPGSYLVATGDSYGTMLEIYPLGSQILPGLGTEAEATFSLHPHPHRYTDTHIAVSVNTSEKDIKCIAAREGWRAVRCNRDDLFEVIEFWVENRLMVEFLPPALAARYLEVMQPQNLAKLAAAAQAGANLVEALVIA
ncbi:hypothetical protein BST81_09075 [Leptolyngbya sp. 'hensonii']|uniref:hypothetical protein n=1 Tax=Leptolyngbya sp. 'hensonii' TaxID=1922337 RepID=UPI00094FE463|nr:hypothetical protein [Leptolyngbya sp. 'hensonii']OLP18725.1 hypothetical protein BST81_09075 [Leptolyngbya sp. 'hensonii']